ncbi:hypothetical protein C900_01080 [Fulvivirga imtechensis AK7]|uniref:YtxH domain-containing protein n=1 Tax=Fulvivirga imtechensis AK7 TaxID=1237149 RepID=L8JUM1_9BACT|nr:YtxH domain-containing protein [Fulvivirga imtechensis]ELR72701.1 hypothetical protein C900_01080 [Fulvivirga imtechensis AK7]
MKTGKTLALALGIAAGALVAVVVTGRSGKKIRKQVARKYQEQKNDISQATRLYDDSEAQYI